ncbi:MAG: hypothetical protein WA830_13550 [Candidatus Sulfotelmatobacter sp.]
MTENGSESLPFEPPEQENARLREENARLRRLLAVHSIPIPQLASENQPPNKTVETSPPVDKEERARKRIALFRSLFRGREDVFARRWENDDGRHGYMPVVIKDWKAINRSRPEERKRVDQKTRKFIPLTDAVIESHLLGKDTVGVYALLPDETCWFLAADFDKKTWEYDSLAFLETCQELNVPAALERSRSGKGGHIWIFFDRVLPAITARKLGCVRCPLLLTGRTEHLQYFAAKLAGVAQHVFVLKGGMGKKQRRETAAALAAVPENESRVILATGSYIGEGFDDARLDTLFLAMPISWKGTLQQYVGRLHRLHADKRFVQVYDYVDSYVLMLARMFERRLKGYAAIGYVIEQGATPPCQPAAAHP